MPSPPERRRSGCRTTSCSSCPRCCARRRPDLTIGFFNHIPFPPYGIYSQLPWRRQIIEGLLGADVIGFQRVPDAGNFSRAVRRLTGYATRSPVHRGPATDGEPARRVVAKPFPISIDVDSFEQLARKPEIAGAGERDPRRASATPKTVMLGVDRLDYTKGIGHRLKAFGELLAEGRVDVEDVTLVQVASPSRERVEAYMQLRDEIELTVGRINGDFGTISHSAISYLHHGYPREEMVALYLAADVMLVTALRDGMNLVAKEYVASRARRGRRARAQRVHRRVRRAAPRPARQPARHRRPEGCDRAARSRCRRRSGSKRMRALRKRVLEHDVAQWSRSSCARSR